MPENEEATVAQRASQRAEPSVRVGHFSAPPPPRLSGMPLFGQMFEFLSSPHQMFIRGYRSLGPVFSIHFMGRRFVALAGAESVRFVAKHERELLISEPVWREFVELFGGKRALINSDGPVHAELRKRFRPTMSRSVFEKRLPLVAEVTQRCLERWDGQVVPLERFSRDLVFHQLAALMDMEGVDPDTYYEDLLRVMHTAMEVTVGRRWPRIFLRDPRFQRSLRRVSAMGLELFRAVGESDPEEGLFPVLRRCVRDGLLAEPDVPLLAITPYFAGIDTVAAALSFMLAVVYREPELAEQLREEADAASALGPLDRKWLGSLRLSEAVKMEVGRRYPSNLAFVRQASKPFAYAGHQIEAGDQLLVAIGAQSLMEEYFSEPEKLDPSRFLGKDAQVEPGALNPYGAGAHTCLGAALADAQLIGTLPLLLRFADIELVDAERPLRPQYAPYPLPKGDKLRIHVTR